MSYLRFKYSTNNAVQLAKLKQRAEAGQKTAKAITQIKPSLYSITQQIT